MRTLAENLTQYAAYHRDRRNIATHFVGVPMIVFAIVLALTPAAFPVANVPVSLAALLSVAACLYYFRLSFVFGATMAVILFVMCAIASELAHRLGTGPTLLVALVTFVLGWGLQFLGHKYEGMKPAFFDDARQLLIGPLFVLAEVIFAMGAQRGLQHYIEERVGPTVARRDGRPIPIHDDETPVRS
jgi:uncharacterized membrane protein YGL010W